MGTVKEFVREKLQERGCSTSDDLIMKYVKRAIEKVCILLPHSQEDSDLNRDFVKFMFEVHTTKSRKEQMEILAGKVMDERDDLAIYKAIRQALVAELEKTL